MVNGDRKPVGRCSQCGGVVSLPTWHMSVNRPVAACERCGATVNEADKLPVVRTVGGNQKPK